MLKIAICDDTPQELRNVSDLTNEYLLINNIVAEVRQFEHPNALSLSCEREMYHIFLLDMVMPGVSGLELGRKIRRQNTDAQIVYISTEPGFALDAYAVNPLHYLLKPVDKSALFDVLDKAVQKANSGAASSVTVKTHEGLQTISADTILCVEYKKHKVLYTFVGGNTVETMSITESFSEHIAPLFLDKRFISPHASFVVNMCHVTQLDKTGFTLKGNIFVPVSSKQYSAVRNAYINYRLGKVPSK